MSHQEPIVGQIPSANPTLWAVKAYLDLISRDDNLVYGSGLKRLFTLSSGLATFNDGDIEDATNKALKLGLIPFSLHGFMIESILKNCTLYGSILRNLIFDRILSIANGDVQNPEAQVKYSPVKARRSFYVPPVTFIKRAKQAIVEDCLGDGDRHGYPTIVKIQDVAVEADFLLNNMQGSEGSITPVETSFGALTAVVEGLVSVLEREAYCPYDLKDYRPRSRGALKILWVITKLLYGDLSVRPERKDLNLVDLCRKIHMTDGTLAAIPFPIPQSIGLFQDCETQGDVSMKGRVYLAAVSAAAFYSHKNTEEG